MGTVTTPSARSAQPAAAVSLLGPIPQTLWGWPAVLNFVLGGLGAGLYLMTALPAGHDAAPVRRVAAWLGPALVLAGFAAVATEAGRPWRGPRVLTRVRTSWMTRELWLGGLFALSAAGAQVTDAPALRVVAVAAAGGLALAQGLILRHARGVAAWAVPPVPAMFLTSALVSGAGLSLALHVVIGRVSDQLLGLALVTLIGHLCVFVVFLGWSAEAAFVEGVRPLRAGMSGLALPVTGFLVPSFLAALAVAWPSAARPLAVAAGLVMVASQVAMKATLIRKAGQLRSITLPPGRLPGRLP